METIAEKEMRRRKISEAIGQRALEQDPNQMVSGRAVPYNPIQGISKLLQAYISRRGLDASDERIKVGEAEQQAGTEKAVGDIYQTMKGTPQQGGPLRDRDYQPFQPEVQPDLEKAAMDTATNKYLSQNPAAQKVMQALLKERNPDSGGRPFYSFLPTAGGYAVGNGRTGNITPPTGIVRATDDPNLQEQISRSKETGKQDVLVETDPVKASRVQAATQGLSEPLTPAQQKIDQKFAEDYEHYTSGGGFADVQKGLQQLKEVRDRVVKEDLTGPMMSVVPDIVQKFTNHDEIAARGAVEEVVQRNLRLVLGAQFTQKEGERLIQRSYDEGLSPKENEKRLNRLIKSIEEAAIEKQSAVDYFRDNGTLKGWEGKLYTKNDFLNDDGGSKGAPEGVDPKIWDAMTPDERALWN